MELDEGSQKYQIPVSYKISIRDAMYNVINIINPALCYIWGFPCGSVVKNPPANAGEAGFISRSGRSPGEGNGNPLQYSCLENPMDRGAWWATIHEIAELDTI